MNVAILLSGGIGSRVGGNVPKQYLKIKDKRIVYYSLEALAKSKLIDKIVIVAALEWIEIIENEVGEIVKDKILGYSNPGETRQLSILNGLNVIRDKMNCSNQDNVFIHDAARPYLTEEMIEKYILSIEGHDGVIPVIPMKDTIYASDDGKIVSGLLDRNKLFAGQAPEVFRFNAYYQANVFLMPENIKKINGSTEPAIISGMDIIMVEGEEKNIKITTQEDLIRMEKINDIRN